MHIRKTNNLNKYLNLIVILLLLFNLLITLSSCEMNNQKETEQSDFTVFPEEKLGMIKNKKIYFTSIGQSEDIDIFKITVLDNLNLFQYEYNKEVTIDEIADDSILFVFVGCSLKALGSTGTTIEGELNRTNELVCGLKEKNIKMIGLHVGGKARRGSTSNQFIEIIFENSDINIFVESGNFDNMLTDLSIENNIPCYQIVNISELNETIKLLYGED